MDVRRTIPDASSGWEGCSPGCQSVAAWLAATVDYPALSTLGPLLVPVADALGQTVYEPRHSGNLDVLDQRAFGFGPKGRKDSGNRRIRWPIGTAQRSAKPPPPVQIRAAPPISLRNQRLTDRRDVD
jgi:hypothetical protein